ncbi:MAG: respiratory nitrate reductase subunit gamma [Coriobacteriia bacterium]|nr:respiratory nitrate reductase subunit gamma [Coriobacteriia bacterium]
MDALDIFLWGVAPYLSFTILIVALVIRRLYFERDWSAKSSEFLDKKNERIWTPLFHLSLLFVFFGHLGGFLIPPELTASVGITEEMYHALALGAGGPAGIVLVLSTIMLLRRRYAGSSRMKANSSPMDKFMYVFLGFTILAGLVATFSNIDGSFDYRVTIMPWIRGILVFRPDVSLMVDIPLTFKIHMVSWMILFALIPFTRLVHLFSGITAPIKYLVRKPILYLKKEDVHQG